MFLSRFHFPIAFDTIDVLFGKFINNNVHNVDNSLTLVVKQFEFACKYKTVFKLDMSASSTLITNRLLNAIFFYF